MQVNRVQAEPQDSKLLHFSGSCGYDIQSKRVIIRIGQISNRRVGKNISGTLSVELWALHQPYTGGEFTGVAVAGTQIGELLDQHFLTECEYDLLFQEPPEGTWQLALMLREWTPRGFVTRDHVNFTDPYVVKGAPLARRDDAGKVISVNFGGSERNSAVEKGMLHGEANVTRNYPRVPAADDVLPVHRAETGEKVIDSRALVAPDTKILLGQTNEKEIAGMNGVSENPAGDSDPNQGFESLDDARRIKGMWPKLLEKIRELIGL